ncbi:MAG: hypothetical protein ABEJ92_04590 [Halobacteriales archaeon]
MGRCGVGPAGGVDAAARSTALTVRTYVAPGAHYDRLTGPAALRHARENGTLTPASVGVHRTYEDEVVAYRDVVVHRVRLNGSAVELADRLAGGNGSTTQRFVELVANGTVRFELWGATACPPELALNASLDRGALRVLADPANDTVSVVLDTDRLLFDPPGSGGPTTDTFVHGLNRFVLELPAAGGLVNASVGVDNGYHVEPAAAELGGRYEGLLRVDPASGQTLSGRTSLAPGNRLNVTLVPVAGVDDIEVVRTTVDRARAFTAVVDLADVPDGTIDAVGYESITEPPVAAAGATFVAVGNATGALVDLRAQNTTGEVRYGPTITTTHGGFVAVRNASGGLVGVSEYRRPGAAVAQIDLEPALDSSQRVTVTVYRDANGNRRFDDGDVPYRVNGSPVRDTALVTLEGQPPTTTEPSPVITYSTSTPTEPTPASPTSSPGQPGFGMLATLVGGLVALGLRAQV